MAYKQMKICEQCKQEFPATRSTQRFCDANCRNAAHRIKHGTYGKRNVKK